MSTLVKSRICVCMIISCFHPVVGGGERQAQQLAARLVKRGVDVRVITRRYQSLPRLECVDGVPVHRIPIVGRGPLAALAYVLGTLRLLARTAPRSILHCHQALPGTSPAVAAALAKRRWGNKVVVKLMGSRVCTIAKMRTWPIRHWLLNHADALVVTNAQVRDDLQKIGLDAHVHVLPNGVDTHTFHPPDDDTRRAARHRLGLPTEGMVALFVGRLNPVKALDVLLQAWATIGPQAPGLLTLVGGGPERGRLEGLADQLGVRDSVHFAGPSDHILDWYHSADLFALPSHTEGLSNAMLEAMACGLPVVVTAVGGAPEAIEHETNGLLVPPDDAQALGAALLHLIVDVEQSRLLGRVARQTSVTRYALDAIADRYIALYTSLLDGE